MLKRNFQLIIIASFIFCYLCSGLAATSGESSLKIKQRTGIVKMIDSSQESITIVKKSVDLSFEITGKTKVKNGKQAISLSDIKVGDKVTVKYVENGGKKIAKSIVLK